ncbi:Poly(U)-specific endoribonuclease-B [Tetrabaena socialis]|uniref:Poly(U)-specific endoribonuclease-B n=1 Tax=Tetrabaena socialis TaxID=47790 RepID=A0A2J7ZUK4_9CHLO|nr:Poly(U)-specific endoribonuclease-B [Tetrabaena socialis]|eukprot:PNH03929.1 Poly(U)-specific endoribonuclease-B [Tetrabaena socialis]
MAAPEPTPEELASLIEAGKRLWALDENRLTPGVDYAINLQSGKSMWQRGDAAPEKLFKGVKKDVWTEPTFVIFYALLDNYSSETGVAEVEGAQEKKEISDFLDAVLRTKVMKYCHKYCVERGMASASVADFKKQLIQMWFSFYRRDGGGNDSCGFEHVFVGESKGDTITGFHNWIQFYIEEGRGNVDYVGYVRPKTGRDNADDEDRLVSVQFSWKGEEKSVSTFFVGTSPEFELALYTMCFLCGEGEKTFLEIAQYDLNVVCYRISSKYGDKVATAYPDLLGEDPSNELAALAL